MHNNSLFEAPPSTPCEQYVCKQVGLRPTNPQLVQACLTAYLFFLETNHVSMVFGCLQMEGLGFRVLGCRLRTYLCDVGLFCESFGNHQK